MNKVIKCKCWMCRDKMSFGHIVVEEDNDKIKIVVVHGYEYRENRSVNWLDLKSSRRLRKLLENIEKEIERERNHNET